MAKLTLTTSNPSVYEITYAKTATMKLAIRVLSANGSVNLLGYLYLVQKHLVAER
jgi:hypothetical protein